jgi:hypothetical protein
MKTDYSIVRQDRFIQATRDSGYKGTDSALSELIDNSIQAGATEVAIATITVEEEMDGPGRPRLPRVMEMVIADNGRGMDAETLRRALRFGDSTRFDDRTGIGRFGMGLPNASVSQCKRVEVYTWRRGSKPLWTYIDVDEVADGTLDEVPQPREATIPAPYAALADSPSGTIVVWKDCDRLDHGGKQETLVRALRPTLGRMFRYFLIADFNLTIDGTAVGPIDPLYLMPQTRLEGDPLAAQHGDTLKFEVPIPGKPGQTSTVEVTLSLLPEEWQVKSGGGKKGKEKQNRRHFDSTIGYSFVRARREIDLIKSPYHAKHWTDRWYRVEVRFDPELDEIFGVTHTKQHAKMGKGSSIYERLGTAIIANVNTLKDTIVARGKRAHHDEQARSARAEETVDRVGNRLKPIEELSAKSAADVKEEVRQFVEDRRITTDALPEAMSELEERLTKYPVVIEYESLPGAPFYRTKMVGRSVVVLLNTRHQFYDRVYQRLEQESPIGKTCIDLTLMALARSEALASDDAREWYGDQRQEWSQHMKVFLEQIEEVPPGDDPKSLNGAAGSVWVAKQ